jgi:hypothetical protein
LPKKQTRRGSLRAGLRAVRTIATSGTSAVGSAVAIDKINIGGNRDDSMTNAGRLPEAAGLWRKGH